MKYFRSGLFFCFFILSFSSIIWAKDLKYTPPPTDKIRTVYAIDPQNQTYHPVPSTDWEKICSALELSEKEAAADPGAADTGGFCFLQKDGSRMTYTITENQVLAENTPLAASVFQRNTLETLSRSLSAANPAQPALLACMDPGKAVSFTVKGSGASGKHIDPEKPLDFTVSSAEDPELVQNFAEALGKIQVKSGVTESLSSTPGPSTGDRTLYLALEFDTGVRYNMVLGEDAIQIRSNQGIRTYRYPFLSGESPIWAIREQLWEGYAGKAGCSYAAVFLKKTDTKERMAGAFYSASDGGGAPLARLSKAVDRILAAAPKASPPSSNQQSVVELYVTFQDTGQSMRIELDESLTAVYLNPAGRQVAVPVSKEDWDTLRSLLNGGHDSEKLMLVEKDGSPQFQLRPVEKTDSFFSVLFTPLPKDPSASAYNTGPKPDYAVNGIHCWIGRHGRLRETTIYPSALVQESNLPPWTPAQYQAETLYSFFNQGF